MIVSARPIPASIKVDRLTTSDTLAELAHFEHQIDGTQPYVRRLRIDASCAALDLLPNEAVIERCVTTDNSVSVLARLNDASVHIEALPRTTIIHVAAPSHVRAEEVAERLRDTVPEPAAGTVPVRIWHHKGDRSATSADRDIEAPLWHDIAENYAPSARSAIVPRRR